MSVAKANPCWDRVARGLQFTNDRAMDLKTITLCGYRIERWRLGALGMNCDNTRPVADEEEGKDVLPKRSERNLDL